MQAESCALASSASGLHAWCPCQEDLSPWPQGAQGPPAAPGVANTGTTEDGVRAPVLPGGEEVPTPPAAAPAAPGTANTGTTEGVTASTAVAPAPVEALAEAPVAASARE